jgi:hypothetical protein
LALFGLELTSIEMQTGPQGVEIMGQGIDQTDEDQQKFAVFIKGPPEGRFPFEVAP